MLGRIRKRHDIHYQSSCTKYDRTSYGRRLPSSFSWQMLSDIIGQEQSAYQLIVTRESDNRMVWNSGKVISGISNNIKYLGVALQPETAYLWKVTVWDVDNKTYTETSRFETGLMNPALTAWEGAEFIGSKEISLDAASHYYFEISTKFQLQKGDKVSLILGANDFRLTDSFQNPENLSGENYVRVEIDLSGVGSTQGAVLNVYRVGYAKMTVSIYLSSAFHLPITHKQISTKSLQLQTKQRACTLHLCRNQQYLFCY